MSRFMAALRSAVDHLHSVVGVAHNDLNPNNIMVVDKMPVLIDFGTVLCLTDCQTSVQKYLVSSLHLVNSLFV